MMRNNFGTTEEETWDPPPAGSPPAGGAIGVRCSVCWAAAKLLPPRPETDQRWKMDGWMDGPIQVAYRSFPLACSPYIGSTKHSITLTGQDDGKGPNVKDLSDALTQATGVPSASQKLIFKGKSLKDMEESLSSYGVKEGSKLMMIGKRNSPEEEAELKKLKDIEKSVEQTAKKLEKVDGELTGLKNGFLAKDLQAEALGKLDHRVKIAAEQFMKILEQIDAMSVPENFSDCKMKKKGLVKTVQDFLAQCDKIEACISDHLSKIQSKNLALAE